MNLARRVEMARLLEHERKMQQSVRELFPSIAPRVKTTCRYCKKVFERSAWAGKSRGFCTERCRDAYAERRPRP